MDEDITNWKQLYQQQEVSMTTLTMELIRLRRRDWRRHVSEGLATLVVVLAAIYYLSQGTVTAVFAGIGLLLFVAAAVGYAIRRVSSIERASFAAPKDYVCELEARNDREIGRLQPVWYLYGAGALAAAIDVVALTSEWELYLAAPWTLVFAVLVQALILTAVVLWRRRELSRLEIERAAIAELRSQIT